MLATSFGPFNRASNKGVNYLCSVSLRANERHISVVKIGFSSFKSTNRSCQYFKEYHLILIKPAAHIWHPLVPNKVHYFGGLTSNYAFEIIHIGSVERTMKNSSTGVNIRFTCVLRIWDEDRGFFFHQAGFILVPSDVKKNTRFIQHARKKVIYNPQHLQVVILECAVKEILPIGLM